MDCRGSSSESGGRQRRRMAMESPLKAYAANPEADSLVLKPYAATPEVESLVLHPLKAVKKGVEAVKREVWQVCHYSVLPKWLQDNEYLVSGHRPQLPSIRTCFGSLFRLHSETGNIWTHLLGCLIFLSLAVYVYIFSPLPLKVWDKVVFAAFFSGAILCLGFSWTFHALCCHSPELQTVFHKLDYCGISLLITGSTITCVYYAFYCSYYLQLFYVLLVTTFGISTLIVSLAKKFGQPEYRPFRAYLFSAFGLSGAFPGIHWLISIERVDAFFLNLVFMGSLYILGALLYVSRIPERYFPGRFDYWGQSHQIFHVLVVAAALVHYFNVMDMAWERIPYDNFCPVV